MRMTAEPRGLLARRYSIVVEGAPVTEIDVPALGPSSATPIAGRTYHVRRGGALRERFVFESDQPDQPGPAGARVIASASQRDPTRREFTIEAGDRHLMLRAVSLWRSEYQLLDLLDSERIVGSIRPAGALRRGVEATLPDDLPLEVRVFILWVVLLLWRGRRVTRAAASD